jgi:hypothetical protein
MKFQILQTMFGLCVAEARWFWKRVSNRRIMDLRNIFVITEQITAGARSETLHSNLIEESQNASVFIKDK